MRQSKAWPVLCSQSRGEGAGLARGEAREAEGRPGGDLHAPHTHTHTLLPRVSLLTWARDSYRVWDGHVYTWITNKDLLYSTENSAQWYVAAWLGWQFVGEWIHVCLVASLRCSAETITTLFANWLYSSTRRARQPTLVFLPGESPWSQEPSRLQSMGSQRGRHD